MKIGILTFHCAHNYGAVLQCFALQEYLTNCGHDVKVINYCPEYLLRPYRIINSSGFNCVNPLKIAKSLIRELLIAPIRYIRHCNFNRFINTRLKLTSVVTNDEIPPDFDVYIVGSDQIWNPSITQGFDKIYFCDFPFKKNHKIYLSYAASMESKRMSEEDADFLKRVLLNFNSISVREDELKKILQPFTTKAVIQVLDPTLLLRREAWEKITPANTIKDKYVLTYQVREYNDTEKIAQHIANQLGVKVINLVAWVNRYKKNKYQTASPEQYLALIRNAECIITTSFHGTAFSIIYNKPFYTIKLNDGKDSRVHSLINALKLEERFIDKNDLPIFSPIDYLKANKELETLRQDSQLYLKSAIAELSFL
jgi:hypothetical protein